MKLKYNMEYNREISPIIYSALEILRSCFDDTEVELISESMYRRAHDDNHIGILGVDIKIMGVATFLSCQLAEDIGVYGEVLANEIIVATIKGAYPEMFN